MNGRLHIRTFAGGLLLAVFGFCMAKLLYDQGFLDESTLSELLPDLVSSTSSDGGPGVGAGLSNLSASLPPPPPPEKHIIVDAGHGGLDGGTQGHGLLEKEWTLSISKLLAEDLRQRGFKVQMTREADDRLLLSDRTAFANAKPNHLFVSVHLNWSAQPAVSGIETFFSPGRVISAEKNVRRQFDVPRGALVDDTRSSLLAEAVQEHVTQVTSANNRGTKDGSNFFVLRNCVPPAVLIECGFLSNEKEANLILKTAYRKRLASGIADGITEFMNSVEEDEFYGVVITPEKPDLPALPELDVAAEELVSSP